MAYPPFTPPMPQDPTIPLLGIPAFGERHWIAADSAAASASSARAPSHDLHVGSVAVACQKTACQKASCEQAPCDEAPRDEAACDNQAIVPSVAGSVHSRRDVPNQPNPRAGTN